MFQENSIETCIPSRVKQITSPGWMHETSARTWCTGKTWRERVEREVGGGIGMGKTCKPKAFSFQYMTKFTTKKKKLSIQKNQIMTSSPITSWQIDGETMKTQTDFIFLGSKTTVDDDCSYEVKRLLPGESHGQRSLAGYGP